MWKEFKKFAVRGNMLDLAVGVIIGGAFNSLVSSLVDNVIMPILSLVVGRLDFSNWFIALDGKHYETLAQAQASGTATVNFGMFLSGVLNRLFHGKEEPAAPTEKTCPFFKSKIPLEATRCPHCTNMLEIEG